MKSELRKTALEARKHIDINSCSKKITEKLFSLEEYRNCRNILCYYPLKNEVSTIACLQDGEKKWYLPRVNGETLEICPYVQDKIKKGAFNIMEPQTEAIKNYDILEMAIIPAVAADINGYRIGYGKGYYDRLAEKLSGKTVKIIIIPSDCLFDDIYPAQYDVKADIVITDKEILRINC